MLINPLHIKKDIEITNVCTILCFSKEFFDDQSNSGHYT